MRMAASTMDLTSKPKPAALLQRGPTLKKLVEAEDRTVGRVASETYSAYIKAAGGACAVCMVVLWFVLAQV
jgi:hypothetical protein